jgi:hypothetical protein
MEGTKRHTAAGGMAGFLFQPERALFWLAQSKDGSQVGIETDDDIAIKALNEEIIVREQDKHSISANVPFGNLSRDLWNTLSIWCRAVMANEVNPSICKFHLVTNKILPDGLAKRLGSATNEQESMVCVKELRQTVHELPESVVSYADDVLLLDEKLLCSLINNLVVCDGSMSSHGDELKEQVRSLLLVPSELPFDDIFINLLGWIHSCALNCWRNKKPAWLKREAFIVYYHRLLERYKVRPFIETAKSLIAVSLDERHRHMNDDFVKQMYLLSIEENDNLLMEAIDDYLCCMSERTRFSVEGNLTKQDFDVFEEILTERWKLIHSSKQQAFRIKKRNYDDVQSLGEMLGLDVLTETLDHRELLAGQQTEQFYLTRGSYHHLANQLVVGWHPDFKRIFESRKLRDDNDENT